MNLPAQGVERLANGLGRPENHIREGGQGALLEPEIQDCGSAGTSTLSASRQGRPRRHFWFPVPVVMIRECAFVLAGGGSRAGETVNRRMTVGWSGSQPGCGSSGCELQAMVMRMDTGRSVRSSEDHRRSLRSVKRDGPVHDSHPSRPIGRLREFGKTCGLGGDFATSLPSSPQASWFVRETLCCENL